MIRRNVSRALLLVGLLFASSCAPLMAGLRALVGAIDLAVPAADVLRRGSTDWERKLAELGRDDPEALELAVARVLRVLDRPRPAPGAPQVEGSDEDLVAAGRARAFLAKRRR